MVALVFASLAGVINSAPLREMVLVIIMRAQADLLEMALHLLVADHRLIGTAFGGALNTLQGPLVLIMQCGELSTTRAV